ncbi:MAG: hemerythrin domain-containing protein [Zoogloea sp.]|nr:hemerythrin domain-containing protein [Zoogloea sp.]
MPAPSHTLAAHHVHCDDRFAAAEAAAHAGQWADCAAATERFCSDMQTHFSTEEEILFPAFEARTGMKSGPTEVMRLEHAQMRDLLAELQAGAAAADLEAYSGAAETLLIFMQQHNMKEENILYPMCDQAVGGDAGLQERLAQALHGAAENV